MQLANTQDFHKIVEAGEFALLQKFSEAILIFGFTKAGKTSAIHMMANSPLMSIEVYQDLQYVVDKDSNFPSAKIGNTTVSQTIIPNIFKTSYKDQKGLPHHIGIFDQPGYGDSAGFYGLLANGYFHYRSFLNTPKLKFVVAIKRSDLDGVAEQFKEVIFLFMSSFANYEKIKNQILKSTAILLTKTSPNLKLPVAKQIITKVKNNMQNMSPDKKALFNEFVDHMIKFDKIFFIPKPKQQGKKTQKNSLLEDINKKTSFWTRNLTKDGCVDMSDIHYSVTSQVLDKLSALAVNSNFNSNYDQFLKYMIFKNNEYLIKQKENKEMKKNKQMTKYSLQSIIETLQKDASGSSNSCQYIKAMENFNNQKYRNFDQKYNNQRQNMEISLLLGEEKPQNPEVFSSRIDDVSDQQRRDMYFIRKFQILQFIAQKSEQFAESVQIQFRSARSTELIKQYITSILQKIYYSQTDLSHSRVFSRYYYIIRRLIQQDKIIVLVLLGDQKYKEKLLQRESSNIRQANLLNQIKKLANKLMGLDINEMKLQYLKNLNFDKLTFPINMEVINFFQSCQNLSVKLNLNIAELVIAYYQKNTKSNLKKLSLIGLKMLKYRVYFENHMTDRKDPNWEGIHRAIFVLSKNIAKILIQLNYHTYAIEIFKNINNPEAIFEIYRQKLKANLSPKIRLQQLLQYADFASKYSRTQLAIQCYQEAFNIAESPTVRMDIGERIHALSTDSLGNDAVDYMRKSKISSSISSAKNKQSQIYVARLNSQLLAETLCKDPKDPKDLKGMIQRIFTKSSI